MLTESILKASNTEYNKIVDKWIVYAVAKEHEITSLPILEIDGVMYNGSKAVEKAKTMIGGSDA